MSWQKNHQQIMSLAKKFTSRKLPAIYYQQMRSSKKSTGENITKPCVSGHFRQWRFLLAAFASTFLPVDFFAGTFMPVIKMLVHYLQGQKLLVYFSASGFICRYLFASGYFCRCLFAMHFCRNVVALIHHLHIRRQFFTLPECCCSHSSFTYYVDSFSLLIS